MASAGTYELTSTTSEAVAKLRRGLPEAMKDFSKVARSATRGGTLNKNTQELIALASALATHRNACIGLHVEPLVRPGAAKAKVGEALATGVSSRGLS